MCMKQQVDQQNSMDTAENDGATEHSLPNSSEVAEVKICQLVCQHFYVTFNLTAEPFLQTFTTDIRWILMDNLAHCAGHVGYMFCCCYFSFVLIF